MLNPVMGVDTGPAQKIPPGPLMTDGPLNLDFIAKVSPASSAAQVELKYLESSIGDIAGILPTESEPQ